MNKKNYDSSKYSIKQRGRRIVPEDLTKALCNSVRNDNKSETTLTKRIANLLFAGTVLAGSMLSIPVAAKFSDISSTDLSYLPTGISDLGYHGAKGGDRNKNASSDDVTPPVADAGGDYPSLEEYIGKLFCTACGKHCPLTAPQCGIGAEQYQEAVAIYETTVSSVSVDASSAENTGTTLTVSPGRTSANPADTATADASGGMDQHTGTTSADSIHNDNSEALQNFLSGLICTGCGRHCPLTALQCARGNVYLQRAKAEFATQQDAASEQISDNQTADARAVDSSVMQSAEETDLMENVMEYAPYGGLMVGGIYYSIEMLKKRKDAKKQRDEKWR